MSLRAKRNIKGAWHNIFRPEKLLGRESSLDFQRKQLPQCEYSNMLNLEGFAELEGQSGEEILNSWEVAASKSQHLLGFLLIAKGDGMKLMQCLVSPFPSEIAIFRDFCSLEIP